MLGVMVYGRRLAFEGVGVALGALLEGVAVATLVGVTLGTEDGLVSV